MARSGVDTCLNRTTLMPIVTPPKGDKTKSLIYISCRVWKRVERYQREVVRDN